MRPFREWMDEARVLLLDGATGTELTRRGIATTLPLWSAQALLDACDVVREIHADYVRAGADVITANTFRTSARTLAHAGLSARDTELTARAVALAREAAGGLAWVAGSQPPLEDCYCPELVPADDALEREHGRIAENLADAGVDLILVETQNTIREAAAATRAAVATGLPVLTSFVCGGGGRLLSRETLTEAARAVQPLGTDGVLVNCAPAERILGCLQELRGALGEFPIGGYGNIGHADADVGWVNTDAQEPAVYAEHARAWLESGARFVGGCCGTTPDHTARLRELIDCFR